MQKYAYPDQKVFIKTHKGYVMSEKKIGIQANNTKYFTYNTRMCLSRPKRLD